MSAYVYEEGQATCAGANANAATISVLLRKSVNVKGNACRVVEKEKKKDVDKEKKDNAAKKEKSFRSSCGLRVNATGTNRSAKEKKKVVEKEKKKVTGTGTKRTATRTY